MRKYRGDLEDQGD